jgi:hypothetical protein
MDNVHSGFFVQNLGYELAPLRQQICEAKPLFFVLVFVNDELFVPEQFRQLNQASAKLGTGWKYV